MRRALQLDPLSFFINRRLGVTLYLARDYQAALAQLNRSAEMEHHPGSIDNYISLIYEQLGQHDEAVQHNLVALHEDHPSIDTAALLTVYQQSGWKRFWRAHGLALAAAPAKPCTGYELGVDDLRVGDLDHGFKSFQQAVDSHCFNMALIRVDPLFDSVRQDLRYVSLLTEMHQ
jgi:tetratricopeptide (TPR) repeat protein